MYHTLGVCAVSSADLPVTGNELTAALIAVETLEMKHRFAGPHDQLIGGYRTAATRTDTTAAEHPATRHARGAIREDNPIATGSSEISGVHGPRNRDPPIVSQCISRLRLSRCYPPVLLTNELRVLPATCPII